MRLKNITGTSTNALGDLSQIEPIKFSWNYHPEVGPCVGVSAQSVQTVVPEAMDTVHNEIDGKDYLGVRYTELIPISIAAIQELAAKLLAATDRITALEALVQQLCAK